MIKKLKGVYTVEAAAIISTCLILFGSGICIAYDAFADGFEYVEFGEDDFDAVKIFRGKEEIGQLIRTVGKD